MERDISRLAPAEGRPANAPSITSKNPFECTFQSGQRDAMIRPSATRDSLASSSPIWSPKSDAKQPICGVDAVSPEGGARPRSASSNLNSSTKLTSTKPGKRATKTKAPHGFRVRPGSGGIGGAVDTENE
jgi:hypothetical protein